MKTIYSGIMNRWLYGNDSEFKQFQSITTTYKDGVFREGYDDPTYMTFKIEFGDWGASVLDRSIIQTGTTVFRPSIADYDALPIGLLNCPYPGGTNQDLYWQNDPDSFNNSGFYSAFAYLRSRNEDTRAKYLYYFVNGLFEIQKNYPFIFKKISGINNLETFNPKDGQRLRTPAKITVECFESLNLKIRTLMEFYRKAAWDDVYQRWILPENMREFKMIIYVFERRVFQGAKAVNENSKNVFVTYDDLNGDIPVKAYECCPCEFNIGESTSWKSDYEAGWNDNNDEKTNIVIEVKNVKTYFKNGLLNSDLAKSYDNLGKPLNQSNDLNQKIDSLMIYDLVESLERAPENNNVFEDVEATSANAISNTTVNSVKALFLNKNILLEREEADPNIYSYIWGFSTAGNFAKDAQISKADESEIHQKGKVGVNVFANNLPISEPRQINTKIVDINLTTRDTSTDAARLIASPQDNEHTFEIYNPYLSAIEDNEFYRGGWISMLSKSPSYDTNRSFWQNLGDNIMNVLTGTRNMALISGATYIHQIYNCLIPTYYFPPDTFNPYDSRYGNGLGKNKPQNASLGLRYLDEQEYSELEEPRKIEDQQYKDLEDPREIKDQQFRELNPEREIDDQDFRNLDPERILPEQEYRNLNDPREINEQDFRNLDPEREIGEQKFRELDPERKIKEQQYKDLDDPRELPEQQFSNLSSREIKEQEYRDLENPRELPEQEYNDLEDERIPNDNIIDLVLLARTLPGFKDMPLDEIRKLPKQELLDLSEATKRSIPTLQTNKSVLLDGIDKVNNTNNKLLELDKGNKDAEDRAIEILRNNKALTNYKLFDTSTNNTEDQKKADKMKNIIAFTKDFTENIDKVRKVYIDNIIGLKDTLRTVSTDVINALPTNDNYIIKKGEKDNNNINNVLISRNDIDQINENMKFLSIKDNDIEKLSFQTLIKIHEDINQAIQKTEAIKGLTAITKNSVATNPNEKTKQNLSKSVLEEPKKRKITVIY